MLISSHPNAEGVARPLDLCSLPRIPFLDALRVSRATSETLQEIRLSRSYPPRTLGAQLDLLTGLLSHDAMLLPTAHRHCWDTSVHIQRDTSLQTPRTSCTTNLKRAGNVPPAVASVTCRSNVEQKRKLLIPVSMQILHGCTWRFGNKPVCEFYIWLQVACWCFMGTFR